MSGLKLAVWSGPRNISTAMMRAWENRPDTVVVDEPFYAHYLLVTGVDHPGRDEIIAAGEPNWRKVAARLTGRLPAGKSILYQKHMTHHIVPQIDTDWFRDVTHAFLIRDPREVIASYANTRATVATSDIGVLQQITIYERVRAIADTDPVIIDASEFLHTPEAHLRAWCARLGVEFMPSMLSWPPGPRDTDGVWSKYWYDAVVKSTGFARWRPRNLEVAERYRRIVDATLPLYEGLYVKRMRV
jgi:Sulfotransferase domain